VKWARRSLFVVLLGATIYLLLPQLGGLNHDLVALRGANLWLMAAGIVVEAGSLLAYVLLYRTILGAEGSHVRLLPVGEVTMAAFRPRLAERLGRAVGGFAHRRLRLRRVDPETLAATAGRLSRAARSALTGRSLLESLGLALANWLLDVSVLYLFFLAVGHHQH